jgi:hypothetical protein
LKKCRLKRRHRLATILPMMAIRRARHRIAALHRLFGCFHREAVEAICRKGNDRDQHQGCSGKLHYREHRPSAGLVASQKVTGCPGAPAAFSGHAASKRSGMKAPTQARPRRTRLNGATDLGAFVTGALPGLSARSQTIQNSGLCGALEFKRHTYLLSSAAQAESQQARSQKQQT